MCHECFDAVLFQVELEENSLRELLKEMKIFHIGTTVKVIHLK